LFEGIVKQLKEHTTAAPLDSSAPHQSQQKPPPPEVISRIYYNVNSSWTGRITLQELRRSNLLQVIALLEKEEDINQITQYFSYEHFYVIYCKFWELDRDHDLFIDKHDLARHSDHG
ncbi:unnamed protein product, partial [Nesidiocoris tenuis]